MTTPVFSHAAVLAYRSSAPVEGVVARQLAAALLLPAGARDWAARPPRPIPSSRVELRRFLSGEVSIERESRDSHLLWCLAQLARVARDERLEFHIQVGTLRGRVSTGGLDAGAQQILGWGRAARQKDASAAAQRLPLRERTWRARRIAQAG